MWYQAKIKLIPKGKDTSLPNNFRPIALTSVVGKLLNKVIASRLEHYLSANGLIDQSLQKGFLSNVNGTMEHIFAVSAIIQNAIQHGLPLSLTFLDLENAFGSVSHDLINDILAHIKLPEEIRACVSDSYSKLCAYV